MEVQVFLMNRGVTGRCQGGETGRPGPPGGDSREQGDHMCLHFIRDEKKGQREQKIANTEGEFEAMEIKNNRHVLIFFFFVK